VAVVGLDVDLANVRWPLILSVAVIGVPATILVNAGEVFLAGKFAGVALNPVSSLRLSILSTAANLMPLPGGVLVRSGDLVSRGSTGRTALRAQVSVGL